MKASLNEDDDAQTLHHRLKGIFLSSSPGQDDAAALQEVRRLCQRARRVMRDSHCEAQLRQLERYARFFFSNEAHQQWAHDTGFGGNGLRGLVLQLLNGIELRLPNLPTSSLSAEAALRTEPIVSPEVGALKAT